MGNISSSTVFTILKKRKNDDASDDNDDENDDNGNFMAVIPLCSTIRSSTDKLKIISLDRWVKSAVGASRLIFIALVTFEDASGFISNIFIDTLGILAFRYKKVEVLFILFLTALIVFDGFRET